MFSHRVSYNVDATVHRRPEGMGSQSYLRALTEGREGRVERGSVAGVHHITEGKSRGCTSSHTRVSCTPST